MEVDVLHTTHGDKKVKIDTSTPEGRKECEALLKKMMKQGVAIFVERGKKAYRLKSYDPETDLLTVQVTDTKTAKAKGKKSKATAIAPKSGG